LPDQTGCPDHQLRFGPGLFCRRTRACRELRDLAAHAYRHDGATDRRDRRPWVSHRSCGSGWPRHCARRQDFTHGLHDYRRSRRVNDAPVVQIKFGTDGWRAIIAREFTFANVERVAQAYADYLIQQAGPGTQPFVVIGFDRRFLSVRFAARTAEVMIANGFKIALFTDAQPTPLISWAVKDLGATGGVMITASHNPPNFNGFKIKAPWGGSAPPETTREVEKLVDVTPPKRANVGDDGHALLEPAIDRYHRQIASYVDLDKLKNASGKVIVDPMHGSAGSWVENFLSGGTLAVETIRDFRDPLFG